MAPQLSSSKRNIILPIILSRLPTREEAKTARCSDCAVGRTQATSISTLPTEIIIYILEVSDWRDIATLARTNRLHQSQAGSFLYQKDAKSKNPKAILWAARHMSNYGPQST